MKLYKLFKNRLVKFDDFEEQDEFPYEIIIQHENIMFFIKDIVNCCPNEVWWYRELTYLRIINFRRIKELLSLLKEI
jgi:hypothetical protein